MSGSIKLIKRRIRSVANTAKLTRAMQMIATVNMRKAVTARTDSLPFAIETLGFLDNFTQYMAQSAKRHPYLHEKPLERVLGIVIASNRGLCGNFHSQLEKKVKQVVQKPASLIEYPYDEVSKSEEKATIKVDFEWLVIGKKGERMVKRLGQPVIAAFEKFNEDANLSELNAVFRVVREAYNSGKYQKVLIFYTQYINSLKQTPMMRQILPISNQEVLRLKDEWKMYLNEFSPKAHQKINYTTEPGRTELIEVIVLLLVKMILYHAALESKASVESARMLAMKNATDAAFEMKDGLTLTYNQLRQSKITQEIAEISAGRAALE